MINKLSFGLAIIAAYSLGMAVDAGIREGFGPWQIVLASFGAALLSLIAFATLRDSNSTPGAARPRTRSCAAGHLIRDGEPCGTCGATFKDACRMATSIT